MKKVFLALCFVEGLAIIQAFAADNNSTSTHPSFSTPQSGAITAGPIPEDGNASSPEVADPSMDAAGRALLAMTTADYPVTPGDVYVLGFLRSSEPATANLVVEGDCTVNLGVFGSLSGAGKSFRSFKAMVEKRVAAAYPGSSPQVSIRSTGSFSLFVLGEVEIAEFRYAWGLSRLSEAWVGTTPYASSRAVIIRSIDGTVRVFDLFKAWRGDLSQDPYLRPGDVVEFSRSGRRIKIGGEVRRPGQYELLSGEGLAELVEIYGDGFTELADPSRIILTRNLPDPDSLGEKRIIEYSLQKPDLIDRDELLVSALPDLLPVAYFEGALGVGVDGQDPQVSRRIVYTFHPGDCVGLAARSLTDQFSAVSDLERTYLLRRGKRILVDLSRFLYKKDFSNDLRLEAGDVVVVPFRQFFVSVSGAVKIPGRYPYVPDRDWVYYVGLAGGLDTDRNAGEKIKIIDSQGAQQPENRFIQPEDSILASSNSFIHRFGRVSSIIGTIISVASFVLTLSLYL